MSPLKEKGPERRNKRNSHAADSRTTGRRVETSLDITKLDGQGETRRRSLGDATNILA